ncbi:MAG: imidazole glycerol phosphate synthase subunit HisH [Xanthomonadales bacterium]|nr:imidazole glycerol phosphate synthase subunit HisH [Xanthomonadales bacterium]
MIGIVDYGCGNLASVANMLKRVGVRSQISSDPRILQASSRLILPGVGSFGHGMAQLNKLGLDAFLREQAAQGKPLLGICLGMQLLAAGSEEGGEAGLGLVSGFVRHLSEQQLAGLPVPHVGWNEVRFREDNGFYAPDGMQRFYFTHSYHFVCEREQARIATTEYGGVVTAAVAEGNVAGVQFHPEKSHRFGMALLAAFGCDDG